MLTHQTTGLLTTNLHDELHLNSIHPITIDRFDSKIIFSGILTIKNQPQNSKKKKNLSFHH